MANYYITGSVTATPALFGEAVFNAANRYTPTDRKEVLGYRPSFPLLVQSVSVETEGDISAAQVPNNGHFLMAATFAPGPSNVLFDSGAKPGSVGTKVIDGPTTTYVFREPLEAEVVWHVEITLDSDIVEHGFYRWNGEVWKSYQTWPQRALRGQRAFDFLDPDKIYDYYARLCGATMAQWVLDNRELLDFIDPDKCPVELLPDLAAQYGLKLRSEEEEAVQREKITLAVPTYKQKGLELAVSLRLRSLGYVGYVLEIWINPDNPANYRDDDTGEKGTDFIEVLHGSENEAPRIGLRFLDNPVDEDLVIVTDYTSTVTFEFDDDVSVAGGNVAVLIGADAEESRDNLIAAINGAGLAVTASPTPIADYPEVDLSGGQVFVQGIALKAMNSYYPSSRVSLHVRNTDGTPLDMTIPQAEIDAFKELMGRELGLDVLPVCTDIRVFATDLEVTGDPEEGDALDVSDALVLTAV